MILAAVPSLLPAPTTPRDPVPTWATFALAAALLPFSNGVTPLPLAAWLAPLFLLRFVRTQRARLGLPLAFAVLIAAALVEFRGMMPGPGPGARLIGATFAIPAVIPYLCDRTIAPRLGTVAGTLVFPCGWVATEYAMSLTPGATWGSVAYTQYGNLPLLQVISVTGLWGLTFMIAWFAAVGCAVWELRGRGGAVRVAAVLFTTTLTAVVLCGEARLALAPPRGATVRVASFARPLIGSDTTRVALSHLNAHSETAADLREIVRREHAQAESLLARAAVEAHAGAKIVFWAEGNARVLKEDESALLARGQEVARANHVYLGMALSAWDRARRPPRENKIALVDPAGGIAWQYLKTFPVPGAEARTIAGDGRLRMLDTPLGRLTAAICYDADFPRLLGQAGALHADILLDPADDWEAIDPLHTRMASFRAIEQGVNLIRQTANGRSAAYDYEGHVLGEEDYFGAPDHTMIAQVPVHGVRTIYTRIGDVVAWLCVATLAWLAVRATVARPRVTV